jgi:Snf7
MGNLLLTPQQQFERRVSSLTEIAYKCELHYLRLKDEEEEADREMRALVQSGDLERARAEAGRVCQKRRLCEKWHRQQLNVEGVISRIEEAMALYDFTESMQELGRTMADIDARVQDPEKLKKTMDKIKARMDKLKGANDLVGEQQEEEEEKYTVPDEVENLLQQAIGEQALLYRLSPQQHPSLPTPPPTASDWLPAVPTHSISLLVDKNNNTGKNN